MNYSRRDKLIFKNMPAKNRKNDEQDIAIKIYESYCKKCD